MLKFFSTFVLLNVFLLASEPITAIPTSIAIDVKKANLGKELFFDKTLSRTNEVSCHSCHLLNKGGVDNLQFSVGVEGRVGNLNTPTVFNSTFNFVQFWNGRVSNLKAQILDSTKSHTEMDMDLDELVLKLSKTYYLNKFLDIYKDGITADNISDAIAEYVKSLITPNSPFDRYLKGDENAISVQAKRGYKIFKEQGCIACHQGRNVGGNSFQRFGSLINVQSDSTGRFEVTNDEQDMYYFKVPSLRNIELTSPYLHDGRMLTLEDTVKFMSNYQLGQSLTKEEIDDIVSFLKTLSGQLYDYEK